LNLNVPGRWKVFRWGRARALGALVLVGAAALYAPFVEHPFLFDDAVQISENRAVTEGAPIVAFFLDRDTTSSRADYNTRIYRPLRNLGFRAIAVAAGRPAAGLRALPFGVVNLVLYFACVALVFAIARTLVGEPATLLAAALFAAAPVHVETVLYASALGDLLSAALELAALLVAVSVVDAGRRGRALVLRAATSLVLAALAMAAKEMAVTGVAVLALWLSVRRALWSRRGLALVAAHGLLALGYLALRTAVLGQVGQEAVTARTLASGLREAPWLLVQYARITLLPLGHSAAYVVAPPSPVELALALALIAGAALLAWRARHAAVRLGLGWFAIALLPVLHLVPLWADLADRFAFVPSVGLALAAAGAIDLALSAGRSREVFTGGALVLALYVVGGALEARNWSSDGALWTHAAEMAPASSLAQSNLGFVRLTQGRPEEALAALDRAVALGRDGADVSYRRATALAALGRLREARDAASRGRELDPDSARVYALLADVEGQLGDLEAAGRDLAHAEALAPDQPSTTLARAGLAERTGHAADAAATYVSLTLRFPREARFHFLAARAFLSNGERGRAVDEARACVALEPGQPQCEALLPRDGPPR
jgi:tetratricopeptide (TPR) repeat protein